MASSSKKCLNPSDSCGILERDRLVEILESDESKLSDTDESSELTSIWKKTVFLYSTDDKFR